VEFLNVSFFSSSFESSLAAHTSWSRSYPYSSLTLPSHSNGKLIVDFHCAADTVECSCACAWVCVFFFIHCFRMTKHHSILFLSKANVVTFSIFHYVGRNRLSILAIGWQSTFFTLHPWPIQCSTIEMDEAFWIIFTSTSTRFPSCIDLSSLSCFSAEKACAFSCPPLLPRDSKCTDVEWEHGLKDPDQQRASDRWHFHLYTRPQYPSHEFAWSS